MSENTVTRTDGSPERGVVETIVDPGSRGPTGSDRPIPWPSASSVLRVVIFIIICAPGLSFAQTAEATRRDLAVRLVALDAAWESSRGSQEARARAVPIITRVVNSFFRNRFADACETLGEAIFALERSGNPPAERRLSDALALRGPRIIDLEDGLEAEWMLHTVYSTPRARRAVSLEWFLMHGDVMVRNGLTPVSPPVTLRIGVGDLPEGEYRLRFIAREGEIVHRIWEEPLSLLVDARRRVNALRARLDSFQDRVSAFEWETVRNWLQVLEDTTKGDTPESNYPIGSLLGKAENAFALWDRGASWWTDLPGDHWVANRYGGTTHYFRLFVPATTDPSPRPLVIALHGAGGNEHLFFESYGLGLIVSEAARRGWVVIAPRSTEDMTHIWAALDLARENLGVDMNRVFLIGHSMGGFQTLAAALQDPAAFAGIAVYAAGTDASMAPIRNTPVFLAVGAQEIFLLRNLVRNTRDAFSALGPCCFEYKEYAPCEHLMVVREALPESFVFLEATLQ